MVVGNFLGAPFSSSSASTLTGIVPSSSTQEIYFLFHFSFYLFLNLLISVNTKLSCHF
jgi:hypothetical protein